MWAGWAERTFKYYEMRVLKILGIIVFHKVVCILNMIEISNTNSVIFFFNL